MAELEAEVYRLDWELEEVRRGGHEGQCPHGPQVSNVPNPSPYSTPDVWKEFTPGSIRSRTKPRCSPGTQSHPRSLQSVENFLTLLRMKRVPSQGALHDQQGPSGRSMDGKDPCRSREASPTSHWVGYEKDSVMDKPAGASAGLPPTATPLGSIKPCELLCDVDNQQRSPLHPTDPVSQEHHHEIFSLKIPSEDPSSRSPQDTGLKLGPLLEKRGLPVPQEGSGGLVTSGDGPTGHLPPSRIPHAPQFLEGPSGLDTPTLLKNEENSARNARPHRRFSTAGPFGNMKLGSSCQEGPPGNRPLAHGRRMSLAYLKERQVYCHESRDRAPAKRLRTMPDPSPVAEHKVAHIKGTTPRKDSSTRNWLKAQSSLPHAPKVVRTEGAANGHSPVPQKRKRKQEPARSIVTG